MSNLVTSDPSLKKQRRTQLERRAEAENRLLDAAVKLVAERGTFRMTLAEVGQAAGYSRGLATHHFGTKANLLRAVMKRIHENFLSMLHIKEISRDDFEFIEYVIQVYFQRINDLDPDSRTLLILMVESSLKDSDLGNAALIYNQQVINFLVDLLEGLKRSNAINDETDSFNAAVFLMSTLRGLMLQCLVEPGKIDLNQMQNEVIKTMRMLLCVDLPQNANITTNSSVI